MTPISLDLPGEPGARLGPVAGSWFSPRRFRWIAWALAAIFCLYRLATFVPQPLDSPHTLRPILNAWLDAFLRHYAHPEAAYESWRALSLLSLLAAPGLALLNYIREHGDPRLPDRAARVLCSRTLLFFTIAVTLVLCRFPTLLDYQLNPDEGQFLSAAHKLFYDANFFRSVDCGTSGPLNIYPLMLPAIVGLSPDYASGRVLVLLIAFCGVYLFYRTVCILAPESIARIAILPLAGALAVMDHPNLVCYSSEQIPALLVSTALYVAVRILRNAAYIRVPAFLLGVLVSAAFFSKMQSVPIVGAISAVALLYACVARRNWQPALFFVAGIMPLQIVNAGLCLATGVWKNFWITYIVSNQYYAGGGSNIVMETPRLLKFFIEAPEVGYFLFTFIALCASYLALRVRTDPTGERRWIVQMALVSCVVVIGLMATALHAHAPAIFIYLTLLAIFTFLTSSLLLFEKSSFGLDPVRWFGLLSAVVLGAAVFSIYRPHRNYHHYLLFLFVPVSAAMAWLLISAIAPRERPSRAGYLLLFVALSLTFTTFVWGSQYPGRFPAVVATLRQPEGDWIRSITSPKGRIFVWGWTADPYLGSGRVVAIRDLNFFYQFAPPDVMISYYRDRMMNDLTHAPPELIIDAFGPSSFPFADPKTHGIDQVPEFARFVREHYRQVADAWDERFFLRADLVPRLASIELPPACAATAVSCMPNPQRTFLNGAISPVTDDLPPVDLPAHALMEVQFTPFGRQTEGATILNNEAAPRSFRGFRFQNMGGDLYRLVLGLGDRYAISKPIPLADGVPVSLRIELSGTSVRITTNGALADALQLPAPLADGLGPINIGSWINGASRFSGTISFFQIVDIDLEQQH